MICKYSQSLGNVFWKHFWKCFQPSFVMQTGSDEIKSAPHEHLWKHDIGIEMGPD